MSYCRAGEDSDVYVIKHVNGYFVCYHKVGSFGCEKEQDMIHHLAAHVLVGEKVPQRAFDRLEAERDGRPWRTDVERALDSLALDKIEADTTS